VDHFALLGSGKAEQCIGSIRQDQLQRRQQIKGHHSHELSIQSLDMSSPCLGRGPSCTAFWSGPPGRYAAPPDIDGHKYICPNMFSEPKSYIPWGWGSRAAHWSSPPGGSPAPLAGGCITANALWIQSTLKGSAALALGLGKLSSALERSARKISSAAGRSR